MKTLQPFWLFLLLFQFFAVDVPAWGRAPVKPTPFCNSTSGNTYALVVGISDYQDPEIPDLSYAHRDAEAFANWLHAPAGGSVPVDNIRLLLNEEATGGKFTAAIDWLLETSGEGDRVVIYFSGHGDMEAKILNQLGFLLLWDSPAHAYMTGALGVDMLRQIVSTLSVVNKAHVLVVADACRAGKLAGNTVIGSQLTNANMAVQFSNEQKILSCQANEYSIEGRQWGGGRGVFSWYLINGLYGLADRNGDGSISLLEIEHYLQDMVTPDVDPLTQIPLAVGDKNETIAAVDKMSLKNISGGQTMVPDRFSSVEQRGLVQDILEKADSSVAVLYWKFQKALEEKRLLEPAGNCAEAYYLRLIAMPDIKPLHNYLRRNYAAALQDDAQQYIQKMMAIDLQQLTKTYIEQMAQYRNFPQLLERAAELLGEEHYLYGSLKARQFLFEGYLEYLETRYSEAPEAGERVLEKYRRSLQYQPDNPATLFYMSECFATKIKNQDSTVFYAMEASKYAETWVLPYAYLAYNLTMRFRRFEEAKVVLDLAARLDSSHYFVLTALGAWHYYQKQYPAAIDAFQRLIRIDSTNFLSWFNLGISYYNDGDMEAAEESLLHSLRINPAQFNASFALGLICMEKDRLQEAENHFKEAVRVSPRHHKPRRELVTLYLSQNRREEAEEQLLALIDINPAEKDTAVWFQLAVFAAADGRTDQALGFLEKAVQQGLSLKAIEEEDAMTVLRTRDAFKALVNQYFPDGAGH